MSPTPPPNPFSPEAIAAHKARREGEQATTVVELYPGTPRDQVEALLSDWTQQSPEVFSTGLHELAAVLEDYAGAIKSAPESVGLEGAYHAYAAGKALEGAGKALAGSVKDRLITLADPEETARNDRRAFKTPSGLRFKIGPSPNPERAKVKDLRDRHPDMAEQLAEEGILYHSAPSRAVYLNRAGSKKTPNNTKEGK